MKITRRARSEILYRLPIQVVYSFFLYRRYQRTAVSPFGQHEARIVSTDDNKTTNDDLMDSLIEGLILEKQTGGYFENYLHKVENKVRRWENIMIIIQGY